VLAEHSYEVRKLEAQLAAMAHVVGSEKVETTLMDEHTLAQLKSLGYTSGFTSRSYSLDGQGPDPKDGVGILKLMDAAEQPQPGLSAARRIELLQQAVRLDPTNPLLYYTLGAKLEKSGRYDEAMKLYRAALQNGIDKGHGRLHSRLGDLLVHAGKKAEAIPEYEQSVRVNPADVATQANLATAYLESGRLEDAERVLKGIVVIDPSNAAAQNGLGVLAIQRQDGTAARAYFEKYPGLHAAHHERVAGPSFFQVAAAAFKLLLHHHGEEDIGREIQLRAVEAGRRDAQDSEILPVEFDGAAHHRGVAAESFLPAGIGQDSDGMPTGPQVVVRPEHTAARGTDAQHVEIIARDQVSPHALAAARQSEARGQETVSG
jgi:tetratricopeptide (TPR) repeat protein